MTETVSAKLGPSRRRVFLLCLLAVPAGAVFAWLVLLAISHTPTDRPLVWLGAPLLVVVSPFVWAATRGPSSSRTVLIVAGVLMLAGVLTLVFFGWLFWQLGQGLENVD